MCASIVLLSFYSFSNQLILVYMALNEHYIMSHMNEIAFSTVYEQLFAKENARKLCTNRAKMIALYFFDFLIDLIYFINVIGS